METLLYGLGLSGIFASRAFLPSFLTACALRWGTDFPILSQLPFIEKATNAEPSWFTHEYTILALGILSLVEILADKDPDAREILGYVEKYTKPALAALTMMGVISLNDASFIKSIAVYSAGFTDMLPTVLVAGFTYALASLRSAFLSPLREADESDETQVQSLISWMDDFWVVFGLLFFFIFPLFIGIVVGFFFLILVLLRRRQEKKEEQQKVTCGHCQTVHFKSAIQCPSCSKPNPQVYNIGFWGTAIDSFAHNVKHHALHLASKKRCPVCATKLKEKAPDQSCPSCTHQPFIAPTFQQEYLDYQSSKLVSTLLVVGLFGMIPFLGAIIGIIYYRIVLVAPFRRYFTFGQSFFTKWFLRLLFLFLMALQLIPLIGALPLMIMGFLNYHFYRKRFIKSLPEAN